jgi:hypothetical protein
MRKEIKCFKCGDDIVMDTNDDSDDFSYFYECNCGNNIHWHVDITSTYNDESVKQTA